MTDNTQEQRAARVQLETDLYNNMNMDSLPDVLERFLLMERSTIDASWHASTHPSIAGAVHYTDRDAEYPQDWEPYKLLDLDTNVTYTSESFVSRTTTWTVNYDPQGDGQ